MKLWKICIFALLVFVSGVSAAPFNNYSELSACSTTEDSEFYAFIGISTDIARSGCCSHHGGVCGCSGSRARCCDGELSPTCGCD